MGVLSESFDGELPESGDPISSLVPAVNDSQLPIGVVGIHQQNADVASSMSAAPFAVGLGDGGNGGDDDDSSSSYRQTSDNGTAVVIMITTLKVLISLLILMSILHTWRVIIVICLKPCFKRCQLMIANIVLPEQHLMVFRDRCCFHLVIIHLPYRTVLAPRSSQFNF